MIPWVRERLAESRARWQNRKQRNESVSINSPINGAESLGTIDDKTSQDVDFHSDTAARESLRRSFGSESGRESSDGLPNNQGCSKWMAVATSSASDCPPHRCQLPLNRVTIRILNQCGATTMVHVPLTLTAADVKTEAVRKFLIANKLPDKFNCDTDNLMRFAAQYKLIRADGIDIDESITVEGTNAKSDDEWLLIRKRGTVLMLPKDVIGYMAGPTQDDIDKATIDVPNTTFKTPAIVNIDELVLQSDVQYDIRKILISLANACAYVIGAGPYAPRIILMLKQRLVRKKRHQTDTVQCFVDMGFPRAKAIQALQVKNNTYSDALEWLIESQSPTTADLNDQSPPFTISTTNLNASVMENIEALLDITKIYCQRDIPPSAEMVQLIIDMGFDETTACEALRATKNNQAAACEWLVGNKSKIYMTEQTDGLPEDSPILIALLASPHVQLSLSNPKMFLAYLSILEDYSTMSMWLTDTETSGIIGHILRTYHEEKHILAINQFSSMV